jgi:DNA modification methylase
MEVLQTFALPGSKVIVPFLGSGNTILAAENCGMQALGWDLSQQYKDSFTVRVHKGKPGEFTSF